MLQRRKGHVVSLASMASYTGCAGLADYCATKAAVLGMHESLVQELAAGRLEPERRQPEPAQQPPLAAGTASRPQTAARPGVAGHSIQTTIVHPMWARTPLIGSWEPALQKSGQPVLTPREVAAAVVDQVLAGRSGSVFVPSKRISGTLLRALPDWLALAIRARVGAATDPGRVKS
jgi:NAD(P)-dependent dehydrogenase (short-subunit alcohol dehydrogenase family)